MEDEKLKEIIRQVVREELKAVGITPELSQISGIVREEIYRRLYEQRAHESQTKSRGYGYYGYFRYRQQYPGYFS